MLQGFRQHVMITQSCDHNCVWAPLRLCVASACNWEVSNLTLLGPSTFANFRCNLVSEKRFSMSARYAWELPEKIVERGVCEEPFVFTVPLPVREPRVRSVISADRPTVSTEVCVKRQKARRVCTNNEPINKHTYLIWFISWYRYVRVRARVPPYHLNDCLWLFMSTKIRKRRVLSRYALVTNHQ